MSKFIMQLYASWKGWGKPFITYDAYTWRPRSAILMHTMYQQEYTSGCKKFQSQSVEQAKVNDIYTQHSDNMGMVGIESCTLLRY